MAGMNHKIRERMLWMLQQTPLLQLARASIRTVDLINLKVFINFIIGALLPCWFSAMTTESVGSAELTMVKVCEQMNSISRLIEGTTKLDNALSVKISADALIYKMIPPVAFYAYTIDCWHIIWMRNSSLCACWFTCFWSSGMVKLIPPVLVFIELHNLVDV